MGALALLRLRFGQINDVQLVEATGLDPDEAILVPGCHRHKVQRDRTRKTVTVLVVGVVAAKLCAARGRIDLHLPPRPIVKLELLEGRTSNGCAGGPGRSSLPP